MGATGSLFGIPKRTDGTLPGLKCLAALWHEIHMSKTGCYVHTKGCPKPAAPLGIAHAFQPLW